MVMDVTFIGHVHVADAFMDVSLPILLSMAAVPDTVTVCPTWPESGIVELVTQCFCLTRQSPSRRPSCRLLQTARHGIGCHAANGRHTGRRSMAEYAATKPMTPAAATAVEILRSMDFLLCVRR